jgi:sRNA-binding carbon storage regulator CsrA
MSTEGRLMISRKSGEAIRIISGEHTTVITLVQDGIRIISGEHTTVITLVQDGSRMRLSVQAPKAVKIYREELMIKEATLKGSI